MFAPISGCSDIHLCVSVLNITEDPYQTYYDARIQIIIDLNNYEIVDATPFVNTGLVDPLFGHAIFETTQSGLMSIFDPNYSGAEDGKCRFYMKVRKIANGFHKTGFDVKIILSTGEELSYSSGFVNFSKLINEIGINKSSITNLSDIAISNNPTFPGGFLLIPDLACNGNNGDPETQTFILHGTLNVDISDYCFMGTIYMDDGAIINIGENVLCKIGFGTLSHQRTTIDPCGRMWKAITVGETSLLELTNSEVNDGLYGIELKSSSGVNVSNSSFNNNYICINENESVNTLAIVNNCKFVFEGAFKPNCWNCGGLRIHDRTYAGIKLNESDVIVAGSEFENLLNGVWLTNSKGT
ncbi:MAG: hypothetical protein IT267_10545 [Saprospiraceae bacterium]|nr:hypothetical protein [Saprospiraceae bacterium]